LGLKDGGNGYRKLVIDKVDSNRRSVCLAFVVICVVVVGCFSQEEEGGVGVFLNSEPADRLVVSNV
jgi:hypothetical protein